MASDPYGFPETAEPRGASDTDALLSLWLGLAGLACGAFGSCMCYLPWLLTVPLSAAAVWYGIRAQSGVGARDRGLQHAASAGLASGLVGLAIGLLIVVGGGLYVVAIAVSIAAEL